ncbi:MAG: hypothetical protein EPN62_08755 [Candidimonas sp.]|nr:MAG: hypothetical protein EPN77_05990 [Candidimonas sp.]TAM23756.1 MAG: hypothetical protein EPN62_08755 [Candidimonas sp.]
MHGKSSAADARRRERARCAAIFGCKAAGRNPVLAATLAFNTSMGRNEAISVLQNTTAAYSPSATRGQRNPSLGGGGQDSLTSSQSAQSRMDAAMKRVAKR